MDGPKQEQKVICKN